MPAPRRDWVIVIFTRDRNNVKRVIGLFETEAIARKVAKTFGNDYAEGRCSVEPLERWE